MYKNQIEKTVVEIELESGKKMNAITYVANPKMVRDGLLPSRSYIDKFLIDGEEFLTKSYVDKLRRVRTLD